MNNGLHDKVALVTGASRGIGAAIADQLAGAGARVFGTATSDAGAAAISERNVAGLSGLMLDVNDADGIKSVLGEISAEAGAPTILVNNAGVTRDQLLMRMSEDDWTTVLDTNLRSVYRLSKACLRGMMKAREGRIISIASVIGAMGNAGQANYAASKAGMIGFTKSVALELGSRNIRCNAIAPGFIETEMTGKLDEKVVQGWREGIPLKRGGTTEDIANACLFFASDLSAYVTGQVLNVDGGMLT